nr:hypothetical protein CPGR_02077 [Mycolicibacterium fortuitum subsp. fortuitum DSM 46621 = ATCC 6841 = JCM 6387]CRL79607.1 hypothetical protein CPGR_02802 [Mycolicibacter nonchromogenicus]
MCVRLVRSLVNDLRMTFGLLTLIVLGVLSLIALRLWLTYCNGIANAHPKHAAKIIEASGRWLPRLPPGKGG